MDMKQLINDCEALIIVASNGLSISEGYHLFGNDTHYPVRFADFKKEFGIASMIQGCFYPFDSEHRWAFDSRMVDEYVFKYEPSLVMKNLLEIVKDKNYFVLTSNTDTHFQQCGFDEERIFEIEGNMTQMQCKHACHTTLYPIIDVLPTLLNNQEGTRLDKKYHPVCPKCGGEMMLHITTDQNFIQEGSYQKQYNAFMQFLKDNQNKKVVVLELGVGSRNRLIKKPMMDYITLAPQGHYISINLNDLYIPMNLKPKAIEINNYIDKVLEELL